MTKNRPRPPFTYLWAILILLSCAVGALPYIPWLASGWTPRLQAFQPWALIAVAFVVIFALIRRRWIAAVIVAVLLIAGVVPNLAMSSKQQTSAADPAAMITVFSFNALKAGADSKELATNIKTANPDVLVLVETSESLHDRLRAQGALSSLKYRSSQVTAGGERDTVVFSRYPLKERDAALGPQATDWYGMPVADIASPLGDLTVVGVHVYPPLGSATRWGTGLDALKQFLDQQTGKPVILAGDYNSTRTHPQFRKLTSVMDEEPSLFPQSTWPADRNVPALVGIDHVLSRGFDPLAQETLHIQGSDHLAIKATLGLVAGE
ncbi:endonuclease/exonuclease/phosphatase family protein [Glutamicibacter sp.]|uniref:endonuclease/exonuclease/phosphatase family protein n=1 Tax=Glutamicibacter sp. TaxID=1931995 RepID=UPI002FE0D7EF